MIFPPDPTIWTGRSDPGEVRFHQAIRFLDLNKDTPPAGSIAILGFPSDEGIVRNQGRPGAKEGPRALRQALSKLLWKREDLPLFDVGDTVEALPTAVAKLIAAGCHPLLLGGGHDLVWQHFQGLPSKNLSLLNFDAHFDLRELVGSGSAYHQIAEWCQAHHQPFRYALFGLQPLANSEAMHKKAEILNVQRLNPSNFSTYLAAQETLYLSLDMDVLAAPFAPGVSAPSPLGLLPAELIPALIQVAASGKILTFDICELSPPHDPQGLTASLAAHLVSTYLHYFTNPIDLNIKLAPASFNL